ncbi:hypothetical protein CsSME_00052845 [Camellia sinensis var. sinensis]
MLSQMVLHLHLLLLGTGCARLGARDHAKWTHGLMIEKKIAINYILGSALIDMYSKCGKIETAKEIFETIQRDDVSVWNALINGLAVHGLALDAIAIFSRMEVENISPDSITFVGILTACSHCGLVEQGHKYFDSMTCYSIQPQLEHYGAMVDLLGRARCLDEAYSIIKEMPMEPDIVIWRALLSACRTQRNSDLGEVAIKKIKHLGSGDYVLLLKPTKTYHYTYSTHFTYSTYYIPTSSNLLYIGLIVNITYNNQ